MIAGTTNDGIATDIISGIQTRRSMQSRRSLDPHRMSVGSAYGKSGDREGLIHAYDEEEGLGLTALTEDSDDDSHLHSNGKMNGNGNGSASAAKRSFSEPIDRPRKSSSR